MNPATGSLSPALQAAWSTALNLPSSGSRHLASDLIKNVLAMWRRLTKERDTGLQAYMDLAEARRAYLAYYFPVNVAKVLSLLAEMPEPTTGADGPIQRLDVLDVGCGPGTATLAILDWSRSRPVLCNAKLEVTAVDASSHALRECVRLWEAYCAGTAAGPVTLTTIRADVQRRKSRTDCSYGSKSYDLIVMANTLNELFLDQIDKIALRTTFVRRLLELLNAHGTLMIVEPALRETSRALHLVRDAVLAAGGCNVYSPCLHERSCPALVKKDDWCHEERPWNPPDIVRSIDRQVGLIKDSLKFSYLLFRKDGRQIVPRAPGLYRVVSDLRQMKGEQRAWLCHEQGRPEVGRLDRERSPANEPFDNWHRGAIVRIGNLPQAELSGPMGRLARIRKDTAVELVRQIGKD